MRHDVADHLPSYGGDAVLLSVSTTVTPEHTTVHAAGEVDLDTVELLRVALADALHDGAVHVIADLDSVTFLDSTGLGALVGAHKRARAAGGRLTVQTSQPHIVRLFEITALSRLLDVQSPTTTGRPVPHAVTRDAASG